LVDGYVWFSVGGGGGRAFSWTGASNGVTPVVAQVLRLLRRRDWNILRTINAMKISPKMTEAATIIPITTLGSPPFEVPFVFAWLASAFPVTTEEVEVTVVNCDAGLGVYSGGDVVTTDAVVGVWEVVVVGLGVGLVVVIGIVVIGLGSTGIKVVVASPLVAVVVLRVVVVVPGSSPPPNRLVKNPKNGSSVDVSSLCLATSSLYRSPSRATRASNREGLKCIAHSGKNWKKKRKRVTKIA